MFLPYFVDILEPMNGIQQLLYLPFNILINEEARPTTFYSDISCFAFFLEILTKLVNILSECY